MAAPPPEPVPRDADPGAEHGSTTDASHPPNATGPADAGHTPKLGAHAKAGATPRPVGQRGRLNAALRADSLSRRLLFAAAVYLATTLAFAVFAGPQRLTEHTPFNHYALLADAWLHGRQDLANGPPAYAMGNDFAQYQGKTYISFPPFPAVLMVPFVAFAGSPEAFLDGQFAVELAGIAPAILFLVLEKLRRTARSPRTEQENLVLAFLYAFGTVYFFTAVEGTVWFVALVIGAALLGLYTLFALDGERPLLAGAMLGCAYLTRPEILLTTPLFVFEVLRTSSAPGTWPPSGPPSAWPRTVFAAIDKKKVVRKGVLFAVPILGSFAALAWLNEERFGVASPFLFGHEFLTVGWHTRITKWGLLGYHYLAKNMGISLTSLPWLPARGLAGPNTPPFQINEHGLALWFTTPLYLWLLWPKGLEGDRGRKWLYVAVILAAAGPIVMDLLYQNSGWRQFGYRFSNDYSLLLFVLLAIGARPMRGLFYAAAAWAIAWNAFGAATFDKAAYTRFYFTDGTQQIVYQPD